MLEIWSTPLTDILSLKFYPLLYKLLIESVYSFAHLPADCETSCSLTNNSSMGCNTIPTPLLPQCCVGNYFQRDKFLKDLHFQNLKMQLDLGKPNQITHWKSQDNQFHNG